MTRCWGFFLCALAACADEGGDAIATSSTGDATTTRASSSGSSDVDSTTTTTTPQGSTSTGSSGGSTDTSTGSSDETSAPIDNAALYVASGRNLYAFAVNLADGTLESTETIEMETSSTAIAVDYNRTRLFVGDSDIAGVNVFDLAPQTGVPTLSASVALDLTPVFMAVTSSDSHLLVADYNPGALGVFALDDGVPDMQATDSESFGENVHSVVFAPGEAYVFVARVGGNDIRQFLFDARTGTLVANDVPAVASVANAGGPRHLRFHPDGDVAYAVNEGGDSVTRYSFEASTGRLTREETLSTLPEGVDGRENSCAEVRITPDGRFLYASNRGHDSIAAFSIEPNKTLVALGHAPTAERPRSFAIDPTGQYLYAAGQFDGILRAYSIARDGMLSEFAQFEVPPAPGWVEAIAVPD